MQNQENAVMFGKKSKQIASVGRKPAASELSVCRHNSKRTASSAVCNQTSTGTTRQRLTKVHRWNILRRERAVQATTQHSCNHTTGAGKSSPGKNGPNKGPSDYLHPRLK